MISLFLSVPLTLISAVGLVLNAYVLVVVILTRQIRTANNILLFHLGTVDVLLGTLFLIFSIPGIKGHRMVKRWRPMRAPRVPLHPPAPHGPVDDMRTELRPVLAGLGCGWVIALFLCMPPLFAIAPYSYIPGLGACGPDFSAGRGTLWYSTLYTAFTLLLPATVIICCNLKILMIARYHRHRIASAIYEVTLSAQVTITHQRNPFFVPTVTNPSSGGPKFRGRSAIYTVFQLLGSFLLLYLPYYVIILWEATIGSLHGTVVTDGKLHSHFYTLASTLLISTLPVNGFLYGVKSKTLRKTFQNYWRKKQTKSEVNQEIQARTPSTCGSRRPSLTPLGFLTRPTIQRRLSETLFDVNKAMRSPSRSNKIKRIASEISWRPASANGLNLSPKEEYARQLKQTTSCNTLQVPGNDQEVSIITEDEIYVKLKQGKPSPTKSNAANLLLQKFFNLEQEKILKKTAAVQNVIDGTPKKSPRILITRAFSEESEKSSHPSTPNREITKRHSSSATTLIERKWRQLRYKDEDSDSDGQKSCGNTTKPLLDDGSPSNRSSGSSETSEASSGRLAMTLDQRSDDVEASEDQLLLSWGSHKKYVKGEDLRKPKTLLLRQTLASVQSQEIVL
ncbi:hypothetical protein NQ318_022352 [Aromia moschata]|uniref:G-protein coupled receptors family 1 profile domain-containing protein n=1 Tax=Aromia moschata TaxID=1265417 RepID=A0AAV8Z4L3_9CUCU|nr:hypothetical protein NQ318_022352 [Aromia moschata]